MMVSPSTQSINKVKLEKTFTKTPMGEPQNVDSSMISDSES